MPVRLDSRDAGFAKSFETLLNSKREASQEVGDAVAAILADVKTRGDKAVAEYTERFDGHAGTQGSFRVEDHEIATARSRTSAGVLDALTIAHDRIRAHHEKQRPLDHIYQDHLGVTLGTIWTPVEAVGVYVPGGLAAYASSVLINVVPAKVAGASRIA
ncbi:histidinol dehydrogenase, partial [Devosia sp.]|uniref:histidinol dehydrogenase n=1 Tax=Devosia sp. TaxID=1871048 RepID=UPI001AC3EC83